MRKVLSVIFAVVLLLSFSACSNGVSQEDVKKLMEENERLESQVAELREQLDATPTPSPTPTPTPTPSPTPKPTPTPEPTPTPAPTPEPTPSPTPEPAETEEQYKDSCIEGYNYRELARNPAPYIGTRAHFRGKVVQVIEGAYLNAFRVNVTEETYTWTDTIYVTYIPKKDEPRILEDDIINIYGEMEELKTYKTVMGSTLTIPQIYARYIDIE